MTVLEETGRSPEEAIEAGLEKLGLPRELVVIEVLDEGTRGLFGLVGNRPARVRLTISQMGERVRQTRETMEQILSAMGTSVEVLCQEMHGGGVQVELKGEHAALIIGKHGQTLEALRYLVNRIVTRRLGEKIPVRIDVSGYMDRHRQHLERLAMRAAEQVKQAGQPVTLEPLNPSDRRTIHLSLQRDAEVRTTSIGEGLLRKLVIAPAERRGERAGGRADQGSASSRD